MYYTVLSGRKMTLFVCLFADWLLGCVAVELQAVAFSMPFFIFSNKNVLFVHTHSPTNELFVAELFLSWSCFWS